MPEASDSRYAFLYGTQRDEMVPLLERALERAGIPYHSGLLADPEPHIVFTVPEGRLEEARLLVDTYAKSYPEPRRDRPVVPPFLTDDVEAADEEAIERTPATPGAAGPPARPNIVWISTEDMSPPLGAYGDALARTPVLDRLARESIRYTHAFTTAPVCAPSRAAIITGMYQTALGAQHMRTTEDRVPELPGPYLAVRPRLSARRRSATATRRAPKPGSWSRESSRVTPRHARVADTRVRPS